MPPGCPDNAAGSAHVAVSREGAQTQARSPETQEGSIAWHGVAGGREGARHPEPTAVSSPDLKLRISFVSCPSEDGMMGHGQGMRVVHETRGKQGGQKQGEVLDPTAFADAIGQHSRAWLWCSCVR